MEKPMIKVLNVNKRYGEGCENCEGGKNLEKNYCPICGTIYALRDVSLELYKGEVLGIVGESGSGKSTLMQSLYFDIDIFSGEVYLDNYEDGLKNILKESSQTKRYIKNMLMGKVYQNPILGLKMNFSSIGNIAEKLISAGFNDVSEMQKRAIELLEKVNIPIYRMKESPENFSGGMQQRVQIAKALSNNPPILLLDEVTTGLDLSVQANVLDVIKTIQRDFGVSIIVVSHDLAVIRMLADRTLVMLNGQVIEKGLTDQILEDPIMPYTQELVRSLL